ncbi:MAG: aminotransferase class V-fold PLP-dependent enzyme [Oscillospiraceae bacterium]|nr:aminotransferase class V-fold PLP-dependent enzyme [Oscillospiraceae bacterium]
MINFDNSATSFPKPAAVKKAVITAMDRYGGNPGRSGHMISLETAKAVYAARTTAADFFDAEPDHVVFTQNCTHALNMAIKGVASDGCHIIVSSLEHNSAVRPVHALSKQGKCTYSIAEVSADEEVTVNNFRRLITPQTRIIICTIGSNVTGQILPIEKIAKLCQEYGICFIADGAQACGVIPVSLSQGINILCTAGHKALYGPSGTGLLVTDGKFGICPIMEGGTGSESMLLDQPSFLPDSLESGTINTAGAIALGTGIKFVKKLGIEKIYAHESRLCEKFISSIRTLNNVIVYRHEKVKKYLPVVSFNIEGLFAEETAAKLSDAGFALRGGLHCSGLAHTTIGTVPNGTVRFSPSVFNNENEVASLVSTIKRIALSQK